jgi:hypothetical protein
MVHTLDELVRITQSRLKSAQQRFNGAQDDYMKRYYKGQVDTLRVVLRDIDAAKFELGIELGEDVRELGEDVRHTPQKKDVPEVQEQPPMESQSASQGPKKRKSKTTEKPQKAKKQKKVETPESPYKPLAQAAIKQGIITKSVSHFKYPLLPGGYVQGFSQLYKAIEEDETLRQTLQSALQEAAVPGETQPPTS